MWGPLIKTTKEWRKYVAEKYVWEKYVGNGWKRARLATPEGSANRWTVFSEAGKQSLLKKASFLKGFGRKRP